MGSAFAGVAPGLRLTMWCFGAGFFTVAEWVLVWAAASALTSSIVADSVPMREASSNFFMGIETFRVTLRRKRALGRYSPSIGTGADPRWPVF